MEKAEINLEKVQLLIDKLKTQVSDHSLKDHLLPTAQMLVAELQQVSVSGRSRASVSVVMPSLAGNYPSLERQQENRNVPEKSTPKQDEAAQQFVLQPPVTVTEQAPEEVLDSNSYTPGANRSQQSAAVATASQPVLPTATPATTSSAEDPTEITTTAAQTEASDSPKESSAGQAETVTSAQESEIVQAPIATVPQSVIDAAPPEPVAEEKQLFELTDEEEQQEVEAPKDNRSPTFPTSIPADSPQIQADASASYEHENQQPQVPIQQQQQQQQQQPEPHPSAPVQSPEQNNTPAFPEEFPENPPQKPAEEKKRQLDFIHENFSAWSDYGIINEAPTLVQNHPLVQKNDDTLHDSPSIGQQKDLNEHLREDREEWAHTLQSTPIENLNNAIGINDRYLFISELFRGDESMYERSIVTLNKFHDFNQAHAWSERELRLKLGWDINNPITQQFEQLVKRRFMNK